MNEFDWDCRQKKVIAHSAKHKVRHTGCRLPSDYLTPKQKKELNGPVLTYNLSKPMDYHTFKGMTFDNKASYLLRLFEDYGGTNQKVADMFGVSIATVTSLKRQFLIPEFRKGKCSKADEARWSKFIGDEPEIEEPTETAVAEPETVVEEEKSLNVNIQQPITKQTYQFGFQAADGLSGLRNAGEVLDFLKHENRKVLVAISVEVID